MGEPLVHVSLRALEVLTLPLAGAAALREALVTVARMWTGHTFSPPNYYMQHAENCGGKGNDRPCSCASNQARGMFLRAREAVTEVLLASDAGKGYLSPDVVAKVKALVRAAAIYTLGVEADVGNTPLSMDLRVRVRRPLEEALRLLGDDQ